MSICVEMLKCEIIQITEFYRICCSFSNMRNETSMDRCCWLKGLNPPCGKEILFSQCQTPLAICCLLPLVQKTLTIFTFLSKKALSIFSPPKNTAERSRKDQFATARKGSHKKKTTKFWTSSKHGGGQRRSQTFYQKKVWTCFKGGGGSKGHVQSSFL